MALRRKLSLGDDTHAATLGPWSLAPGNHVLRFIADGEPTRRRMWRIQETIGPLTVAFPERALDRNRVNPHSLRRGWSKRARIAGKDRSQRLESSPRALIVLW